VGLFLGNISHVGLAFLFVQGLLLFFHHVTEPGGKRGRSVRVPVPAYTGRVFVKGELPDVAAIAAAMPEGEGYRVVMTDEPTPQHLLKPEH